MAVGREGQLRRAREAARAESRAAAPNDVAPGARVAEKIAPPLGHTATSVPSGSAATSDSNAAPSGRRVLAPAVPPAIATVYAAVRRQKVSRSGVTKAGL